MRFNLTPACKLVQQSPFTGPPIVTGRDVAHAITDGALTLRCLVDAWPRPSAVWARDPLGRVLVIHGGNYRLSLLADDAKVGKYLFLSGGSCL